MQRSEYLFLVAVPVGAVVCRESVRFGFLESIFVPDIQIAARRCHYNGSDMLSREKAPVRLGKLVICLIRSDSRCPCNTALVPHLARTLLPDVSVAVNKPFG